MRKAILAIALFILCALNAQATNYYFDIASGNDTTGDGTYGSPWKTIDKCTTGRSGGDECRAAKTAISTLAGTCTFTNGSATVNTSQDLSAAVASGDLIGKNTGVDGWWVVSSANTTTITLTNQYWAPTGSGSAATAYKVTPVTASEKFDVNANGSAGSYVKISGGWTLATQAQDGITAFLGYSTGDAILLNNDNYIEITNFIIRAGSLGAAINNSGGKYNYFHDIFIADCGYPAAVEQSSFNTWENIYITSGTGVGFNLPGAIMCSFKNIYIYSPGNGTGEHGVTVSGTAGSVFENLRVYNSYDDNINFAGDFGFNHFKDCYFVTNRRALNANNITFSDSSKENRFYNTTASGAVVYTVNCSTGSGTNYFIDSNFTAGGTGLILAGGTTRDVMYYPSVVYNATGSDTVRYYNTRGTVTIDSSAAARSGKALKFAPVYAGCPMAEKVGNLKIANTGADITLGIYIKDDASFDGLVHLLSSRNGKLLVLEPKTPTTSYAQVTVTIAAADLVANEYLDLYVIVQGSAGNVWADDFSASQ